MATLLRVRHLVPLALAAGCQIQPRGYVDSRVPGITIISAKEAADHKLRGKPLQQRFGPGRDGTDVVTDFLAAAQAGGARWVSSLAIHLTAREGEKLLDCVTYIGPEEEIRVRHETVHQPGRTEFQHRMKPVTRLVTRSERECRTVQRPYTTTRTEYEYEYDYATHRSRSVPRTRTVTEYRSEQDCHQVFKSEYKTTYEFQTEVKWIPPRTEVIARYYSHWNLVESEPACAPLAADATGQNRIEGVAWQPPPKEPRAKKGAEEAAR